MAPQTLKKVAAKPAHVPGFDPEELAVRILEGMMGKPRPPARTPNEVLALVAAGNKAMSDGAMRGALKAVEYVSACFADRAARETEEGAVI